MEFSRDEYIKTGTTQTVEMSPSEESEESVPEEMMDELVNPGSADPMVNLNHNFVQYVKLVHGQEQHRQRWLKEHASAIEGGLSGLSDAVTPLNRTVEEAADDVFDMLKGIRTALIVLNFILALLLIALAAAGYYIWEEWAVFVLRRE